MHILLIEDDRNAAGYLVKGLTESGHVVDHAADGEDGLHMALTGEYDIDTQVSRLRAKIDKDFEHPLPHTTHRSWDRNVRAGTTIGVYVVRIVE